MYYVCQSERKQSQRNVDADPPPSRPIVADPPPSMPSIRECETTPRGLAPSVLSAR